MTVAATPPRTIAVSMSEAVATALRIFHLSNLVRERALSGEPPELETMPSIRGVMEVVCAEATHLMLELEKVERCSVASSPIEQRHTLS